ncbi:hypothetical protein ACFLQ6_10660 [Thermoproteota archaeon]
MIVSWIRKSKKGVSGAISGVFVILICFLALGAIFVFAISQDRYNQVVNERNRMEWEIQNEKFTITHAQRNDNGTLNATIFNFGGMTAHFVDIWVTMKNGTSNESLQELYRVNYHINPAEQLSEIGDQNVTLLPSGQEVTCINLTEPVVANINYTIKVVSERGNTASYLIKYEPPEDEDEPPPLRYVFGSMRLKYDGPNGNSSDRSDSDATGWCNPWVPWDIIASSKIGLHSILIKINITNTCGHDVNFTSAGLVYQSSGKQGQRQEYLGGVLPTPIFFYDGEMKEVIFQLNYNMQNNAPGDGFPLTYVGMASFCTDSEPDADFLSGAVILDGLLVPCLNQPE